MTASPDSGTAESKRAPEEIEREIDGTREALKQTLDALEAKLSPRRRLNQAADSLRETGERVRERGMNAICPDITTMIRLDHTHVLALFRRFRPTTSPRRKQALVANACLALEVHAQLEEEIFYPALAEAVGPHPALEKSVPEHDQMRQLIAALRDTDPYDVAYEETFRSLMREVLHHVADEETILLPLAEELIPDDLPALGLEMTRRRVQLLRPHLKELAATSVQSFPVLFGTAAVGLLLLGWLAVRPRVGAR
jgi:hemerythrin superfamily protein